MWYLKEILKIPFSLLISQSDPDELHQSDWSYNVLAKELGRVIFEDT
jgi:hypothetical protein